MSEWVPDGRKSVAVSDLRTTLLRLVNRAWPYGRIVAVQKAGVIGGMDDVPLIQRNLSEVLRIMKDLQVEVELHASA